MKNIKLIKSTTLQYENGAEMELKYYITMHKSDETDADYYGIRIEKHVYSGNGSGELCFEEAEETGGITENRHIAEECADKLSENTVTPCTLIGVMNDLMGATEF